MSEARESTGRRDRPRRHHWLSACVLRGFTDARGQVHVYDRQERRFFSGAPKTLALETDYHTISLPDGQESLVVEEILSEMEGDVAPVLRRLDGGVLPTRAEHWVLAQFLALQAARTPSYRESTQAAMRALGAKFLRGAAESAAAGEDAIATFLDPAFARRLAAAPDRIAFILKHGPEVEFTREGLAWLMFESSSKFAAELAACTWAYYHAPSGTSLPTCDTPLVTVPIDVEGGGGPITDRMGILEFGTQTLFAVSARVALRIIPCRESEAFVGLWPDPMPPASANEFALQVARNGRRFVYSADEAALRQLVEDAKLDDPGTTVEQEIVETDSGVHVYQRQGPVEDARG